MEARATSKVASKVQYSCSILTGVEIRINQIMSEHGKDYGDSRGALIRSITKKMLNEYETIRENEGIDAARDFLEIPEEWVALNSDPRSARSRVQVSSFYTPDMIDKIMVASEENGLKRGRMTGAFIEAYFYHQEQAVA